MSPFIQCAKKVSELRLGSLDVDGLFRWRNVSLSRSGTNSSNDIPIWLEEDCSIFFNDLPRDIAVMDAKRQFWLHELGWEYHAANPIKIPGLSKLLEPTKYREITKTAFGGDSEGTEVKQTKSLPLRLNIVSGPLETLSAKITSIILDHLDFKDIASPRLATWTFRELPTTFSRRLSLEDMPWL